MPNTAYGRRMSQREPRRYPYGSYGPARQRPTTVNVNTNRPQGQRQRRRNNQKQRATRGNVRYAQDLSLVHAYLTPQLVWERMVMRNRMHPLFKFPLPDLPAQLAAGAFSLSYLPQIYGTPSDICSTQTPYAVSHGYLSSSQTVTVGATGTILVGLFPMAFDQPVAYFSGTNGTTYPTPAINAASGPTGIAWNVNPNLLGLAVGGTNYSGFIWAGGMELRITVTQTFNTNTTIRILHTEEMNRESSTAPSMGSGFIETANTAILHYSGAGWMGQAQSVAAGTAAAATIGNALQMGAPFCEIATMGSGTVNINITLDAWYGSCPTTVATARNLPRRTVPFVLPSWARSLSMASASAMSMKEVDNKVHLNHHTQLASQSVQPPVSAAPHQLAQVLRANHNTAGTDTNYGPVSVPTNAFPTKGNSLVQTPQSDSGLSSQIAGLLSGAGSFAGGAASLVNALKGPSYAQPFRGGTNGLYRYSQPTRLLGSSGPRAPIVTEVLDDAATFAGDAMPYAADLLPLLL